jgi:hypothetical protein
MTALAPSTAPAPAAPSRGEAAPPLRLTSSASEGVLPPDHRMWCEILRGGGAFASGLGEWDEVVTRTAPLHGPLFAWHRAWWEHHGRGGESRIFVFHTDGGIAGIVPVFIDRIGLGPFAVRVARLAGAEGTGAPAALPVDGAWTREALDEMLQHLLAGEGCDAILAGPLSDAAPTTAILRAAAAARPDLAIVAGERIVGSHAVLDAPDGPDLAAALGRGARSCLRRGRIAVSRGDLVVEHVDDVAGAMLDLPELARMEERIRRAEGTAGHFSAWPAAERFERAIMRAFAHDGRLRMVRLRAGDRAVGRAYGYVAGAAGRIRIAAAPAGPVGVAADVDAYTRLTLIERLVEAGARTIDLGPRGGELGARLGARHHDLRTFLIASSRGAAVRRARRLLVVADSIAAPVGAWRTRVRRRALPRWATALSALHRS